MKIYNDISDIRIERIPVYTKHTPYCGTEKTKESNNEDSELAKKDEKRFLQFCDGFHLIKPRKKIINLLDEIILNPKKHLDNSSLNKFTQKLDKYKTDFCINEDLLYKIIQATTALINASLEGEKSFPSKEKRLLTDAEKALNSYSRHFAELFSARSLHTIR